MYFDTFMLKLDTYGTQEVTSALANVFKTFFLARAGFTVLSEKLQRRIPKVFTLPSLYRFLLLPVPRSRLYVVMRSETENAFCHLQRALKRPQLLTDCKNKGTCPYAALLRCTLASAAMEIHLCAR